ncbi:MAG TPA: type I 3-dehydroquinate dehydratase [Candidatus Angelobacter sp.]|nr:type I 3-dehydroquinate dehydratase [Candidatus Angelobacter sp.]
MMNTNAVALVAAVTIPQRAADIREIPRAITWLQIRSDLIGDIPADWLRDNFPGKLLYTLQSSRAGGEFDGPLNERHSRLAAAAKEYDLVELECELDLTPDLLAAIPATKRLISWRGSATCESDLHAVLHSALGRIETTPARYYRFVTCASKTSDGLYPLLLLQRLKRADVIAYSDGPCGCWSRLLSPYFGAPLIFGQLDHGQLDHGQLDRGQLDQGQLDQGQLDNPDPQSGIPKVQRLIADYGFPALSPLQKLYGMVGNRIFQSPSPRLHNAGYRLLNSPALFLPFHTENFQEFWEEMIQTPAMSELGLSIEGLVIVSPYKEAALPVADVCSPMVRKVGACNVFARQGDLWEASTTDPESIAKVKKAFPLKAAVVGCGGAGRAIAAALHEAGAEVTLVNRGWQRGHYAMELLRLPFVPLSEFRAERFDLVVNATPVGRDHDGFPFMIDSLRSGTQLVDLAYGAQPTPLVSTIMARGGSMIDGHDVLLMQVRKQFQIMTGMEMPAAIGRSAVLAGNTANFSFQDAILQSAPHSAETCECSF